MIIVKGDQVLFRELGQTGLIDHVGLRLPAGLVICHDPSGEYLRPCDFYICRFYSASVPEDRINVDDEQKANLYYGNRTRIVDGEIDLPDGDWQRIGLFDQIAYRRKGDRHGLYKHDYGEGVPLFECKGRTRAWRLRAPGDCVADERGFVKPGL